MPKDNFNQGSCLCGKVKVTAEFVSNHVGACHCSMCRNWGGGPFLAVDCKTRVKFQGEESITTFKSSDWAERGFCQSCGSHLFYRLKQSGQYIMSAGLFKANNQFKLDHQVFIDEKPDYYGFSQKTKDMTGAEIFAKFGANQD